MLPGCSIFLDVDDLVDVGDLEKYVAQSACILFFLSQGYLRSKNCIREVRATIQNEKPRVHVWEADASKGGAPMEVLRDKECPPDLQELVFDGRETIAWYRIADVRGFPYTSLPPLGLHLHPCTAHDAYLQLTQRVACRRSSSS